MVRQDFVKIAKEIEEAKKKMQEALNAYDVEEELRRIKDAIESLEKNLENDIMDDEIYEVKWQLYCHMNLKYHLLGKKIKKPERKENHYYKKLYEAIDNLLDCLKKA